MLTLVVKHHLLQVDHILTLQASMVEGLEVVRIRTV